jgi:hypothetical protein
MLNMPCNDLLSDQLINLKILDIKKQKQKQKQNKCQPRILYPAKLSISIDRETKIFHDKPKFKYYLSTNPQRIIKGKLQHKEGNYTEEKERN